MRTATTANFSSPGKLKGWDLWRGKQWLDFIPYKNEFDHNGIKIRVTNAKDARRILKERNS